MSSSSYGGKELSNFGKVSGRKVVLLVHHPEDLRHLSWVTELLLLFLLAHESWHLAPKLVEDEGVGPKQAHPLHQLVYLDFFELVLSWFYSS